MRQDDWDYAMEHGEFPDDSLPPADKWESEMDADELQAYRRFNTSQDSPF